MPSKNGCNQDCEREHAGLKAQPEFLNTHIALVRFCCTFNRCFLHILQDCDNSARKLVPFLRLQVIEQGWVWWFLCLPFMIVVLFLFTRIVGFFFTHRDTPIYASFNRPLGDGRVDFRHKADGFLDGGYDLAVVHLVIVG